MFFKRSLELLSSNDTINVFWSGGLDSNSVLLAFDHFYELAKHKLVIKLTAGSKADSPWIFENVVKKYSYDIMNEFEDLEDHISLTNINVTGDCSDCLLNFPREQNNKPLADFNSEDYKKYELLESTFPASPIQINDLYSLYWWLNFNFCWQFESLKFVINRNFDNYKKPLEMLTPFYSGDDWQIFAVQFYDEIKNVDRDMMGVFKKEYVSFINKLAPNHKFVRNMHPREGNVHYKHITLMDFILINNDYNKVKVPNLDFLTVDMLWDHNRKLPEQQIIEAFHFIKDNL